MQIPDELAQALIQTNLSAHESRVVWWILRETYGKGVKSVKASLKDIGDGVGLDRRLIPRVLAKLTSNGMSVIHIDVRKRRSYRISLNFQGWKNRPDIQRDVKVTSNGMSHSILNKGLKIYSVPFETFWKQYPRKEKKVKAFEAWCKQNGRLPPLAVIIKSVERYQKTEQWKNPRFIPHPTTFINQCMWDDEPIVPKESIREETVCKGCNRSSDSKGSTAIFASGYHPGCEPESFNQQVEGGK